jgi:tetratricopeptide (TPR) repeat protein
MNARKKNIVSELATDLLLQDKTKEELAEVITRYPYFGFAQFLFAKKFNNEAGESASKQLQQAALNFPNPFWFDYLLRENISSFGTEAKTVTQAEAVFHDREGTVAEVIAAEEEKQEDHSRKISKEEHDLTEIIVDETLQGSNDEIKFEPGDEIESEEGVDEAEREKLSKLIEQHLSEFKKPIDSNEEIPIATRVYHAIDYFASQGIKLDPRLLSQDMLGNKVRKFTDWLKQVKRLNENPTDLGTDMETEHVIEKIAQSSNEGKDVITEAMAEVLQKQGKKEKAIQLYQKLSFLNPSKSTYFAAKINELKSL